MYTTYWSDIVKIYIYINNIRIISKYPLIIMDLLWTQFSYINIMPLSWKYIQY